MTSLFSRSFVVLVLAAFFGLSGVLFVSAAAADDGLPDDMPPGQEAEAGDIIEGSYIVVMNDLPGSAVAAGRRSPVAALRLAIQRKGGKISHVYENAVNGFAAEMTAAEAEALRADPAVAYVEPDMVVSTQAEQIDPPWGLDRIDQQGKSLDGSYFYDRDGTGVDVYIADTGIRSTHDEFRGRVAPGFSAVFDGNGTQDCDGHGTHVAGTAGGSTYGVARNVRLFAVRVLDCDGLGSTSAIVAGFDWVIANADGPSVVNVSIGSPASQVFDDAVQLVADAGITVVVAAGNGDENNVSQDACSYSPSRVADAITVGALSPVDVRSSYSNFGTCVDIFAPGNDVTSAWYFGDDETNVISGTSMAAPHVAGVAALYLGENPTATPSEVAAALVAGATPGMIQNAGEGSPNLTLYSYVTSDTPPPVNPPANTVTATVDVAHHMAEGAGQAAALKVEFSDYPLTPVTIDWRVVGGSADPATDLSTTIGSKTLSAASLDVDLSSLLVSDWVIDDTRAEADETVQLTYSVSGGAVAAAATVDLVIIDNDSVRNGSVRVIDDFESDLGWVIDPAGNNAATGNFEVAAINVSPELEGLVYQLGSAVSGTNALVTGGRGGDQPGTYDVDDGSTAAQRVISIPENATYLEVSNYLSHYSNSDAKDVLEIRIGDDVIARHEGVAETTRPAAWSKVRADVSQYSGQDVMFSTRVGDRGAGSLVEAAVDDIIVYEQVFFCNANSAQISWTDAGQSKYWVYRSVDGGSSFSWIGRTLGAATLADPSPTLGAIYQVHYAGIDRVVCETIAEPVPAQFFSCASDGGVLTWTDADQSKYWVYRSVDGGSSFSWIGRTLGEAAFTDPAPVVGATYQVHYAGIPRIECEITAEPPDGLTFSCASDGGVLTWTDAGQSKYWVYRSVDGGSTFSWIGRTLGATTFTDANPAPGARYQVHYAGIPRVDCTLV